jgi:hypothetical protein
LDGGVQQATVRKNQEVAPNDEQEPQSGVWFELLDTIYVDRGTLTVTLTDDADGYVIADAVWVRSTMVTIPAAPSDLSVSAASSSQIGLWWSDNSDDEAGFKIERATVASATWSQIDTVGAGVTTYQDTGLSASTTYYYRVQATNSAGDSSYSNEANDTTPSVSLSWIIDDGDADQAFVGRWSRGGLTGAYGGDYRFNAAGSGSDRSKWTFTDLLDGHHEVLASWTAHSNRATDAPFTLDGGVQQATVRKNQEVAPNDEQEPQAGVWFELLDTIYVDSGTLTVTLTDDADGYVIADAVWVRSVSPLQVAEGPVSPAENTALHSETELQPIVAAARAEWVELGLAADLIDNFERVEIAITDRPRSYLGMAFPDKILIDTDAAGHDWFVDTTPREDEEFVLAKLDQDLHALDYRAVDRIDLLTVVFHELGHIAGLDDLEASTQRLMSGELATGIRRVAGQSELDAIFASGDAWDYRSAW